LIKLIRFDVQGKGEVTNPRIRKMRRKPTFETLLVVVYKCLPKPPILPKANGLLQTATKPRRMSEEDSWSDNNYLDFHTKDGTFLLKGNLPTSNMSHPVMLLDPKHALDIDDLC
jgi:hypothetical protein